MSSKKIYIIDWYNFIYRLFYAIPPFSLKDWTPVNAVFGLAKVIMSIYNEDKPDYFIFTLDYKWKKLREEIFAEYKWTRDKMPTDLKIQEDLIFELLNAFEIDDISVEWYEADDVIGTLVTNLKKDPQNEIFILSWDKDLYQFIDTNVVIYDTMKRKIYHKDEAIEKFWVEPVHIVDYLAICGDSSDNIPGIPGFGPKKAQELIGKFWNLENIYANIDELTGKTKETLIQNREVAFMSKQLATITVDLDLWDFRLEDNIFASREIYTPKLIETLKKFEFKSLLPSEHIEVMKNFDSLDVKIIQIEKKEDLQDLIQKITNLSKIMISTYSLWVFELDKLFINLWNNEVYTLDTKVIEITDLVNVILNNEELELVWFDIKSDLKRMWGYLEGRGMNLSKNPSQFSLF